ATGSTRTPAPSFTILTSSPVFRPVQTLSLLSARAPPHLHSFPTRRSSDLRTWVRHLLDLAPQVNGGRRDMDGLALLAAAVYQDDARSDALAAAAGADAQAVRVVGQMAAVPLLQACARGLASQIPASWWEGYCPVFGAWPVVAEYTGLERKRQLGGCRVGSGWAVPLLRCVFCDEIQHDNLA